MSHVQSAESLPVRGGAAARPSCQQPPCSPLAGVFSIAKTAPPCRIQKKPLFSLSLARSPSGSCAEKKSRGYN